MLMSSSLIKFPFLSLGDTGELLINIHMTDGNVIITSWRNLKYHMFAPSTCFFGCHTCACLEACALSDIGTVPKFITKIVETEVSSIPLTYMTSHLPGMEETLQQTIR